MSSSFPDCGQKIQRFWLSCWNEWPLEILEQCICQGRVHQHVSSWPGDWTRVFRRCKKNEVKPGVSALFPVYERGYEKSVFFVCPHSNHPSQNNANSLIILIHSTLNDTRPCKGSTHLCIWTMPVPVVRQPVVQFMLIYVFDLHWHCNSHLGHVFRSLSFRATWVWVHVLLQLLTNLSASESFYNRV